MIAPLIGKVSAQRAIVQSLLRRLPGYTPGWTPASGSKGYALLEVLARYQTLLDIGARDLPKRNLLALLDTLAISLLPAQAAQTTQKTLSQHLRQHRFIFKLGHYQHVS